MTGKAWARPCIRRTPKEIRGTVRPAVFGDLPTLPVTSKTIQIRPEVPNSTFDAPSGN